MKDQDRGNRIRNHEKDYRAELPHLVRVIPGLDGLDRDFFWHLVMVSGMSGNAGVARSTRRLADDVGVSPSTIVRNKRRLAEAGLILVTSYPNEEGRPDDIDILPVWPINYELWNARDLPWADRLERACAKVRAQAEAWRSGDRAEMPSQGETRSQDDHPPIAGRSAPDRVAARIMKESETTPYGVVRGAPSPSQASPNGAQLAFLAGLAGDEASAPAPARKGRPKKAPEELALSTRLQQGWRQASIRHGRRPTAAPAKDVPQFLRDLMELFVNVGADGRPTQDLDEQGIAMALHEIDLAVEELAKTNPEAIWLRDVPATIAARRNRGRKAPGPGRPARVNTGVRDDDYDADF